MNKPTKEKLCVELGLDPSTLPATYEEACAMLGRDPENTPFTSKIEDDEGKGVQAHFKLIIIGKAIRKDWKPDWTNFSQWKYYPWFDFRSGSGLSYYVYGGDGSISTVGSRLCVQSGEHAKYMGIMFTELYEDMMLLSANDKESKKSLV